MKNDEKELLKSLYIMIYMSAAENSLSGESYHVAKEHLMKEAEYYADEHIKQNDELLNKIKEWKIKDKS